MKRLAELLIAFASVSALSAPVVADPPRLAGVITANDYDGVLNAPYFGTVDSLRNLAPECGYGEVKNAVEPFQSPTLRLNSATIGVYSEEPWDRSVLRLFQELDASGSEIDLSGTSSASTNSVSSGPNTFKRFSFKAVGCNSFSPQQFHVHFLYTVNTGSGTSSVDGVETITVMPMTGSFSNLPGLSEAFQFGTPLLDVAVGNARLRVPIGRTAEMIGQAFIINQVTIGPNTNGNGSSIPLTDCLLPGAAETVFLAPSGNFTLSGSSTGPSKSAYGTPWTGYMQGYRTDTPIRAPDGTRFDTLSSNVNGLRRIDYINPLGTPQGSAASTHYTYDASNFVTEIADNASPHNTITLSRTAEVVTRISTSDGRGWDINTNADGLIAGVIPDSGKGARFFDYNSSGRCTEVRDANSNVMYHFTYTNDAYGHPTVLTSEIRYVDGSTNTAVEHVAVSSSHFQRKEYTGPGEYRLYDFDYDTNSNVAQRLASITAYAGTNGSGTGYTTTFTNDMNSSGSMFLTRIDLPDTSYLTHQYDTNTNGLSTVFFGFRTKTTHTKGSNSLVLYDATYDFAYPSGVTHRLYHRPRVIEQRDGLGNETQFQYEIGEADSNGDHINGEICNQLFQKTWPAETQGTTNGRQLKTHYVYSTSQNTLIADISDIAASTAVETDYAYDSLMRATTNSVDPNGINISTHYQYDDATTNQVRTVIDSENYYTTTSFDTDSRVLTVKKYLTPGGASGNYYGTTNDYDTNGRLASQTVDNKDQNGNTNGAAFITTFSYDRLGRLTAKTVDPGGIGQITHYAYNWQGDLVSEYDTSGRGVTRTFDGRGLLATETPLDNTNSPVSGLQKTHDYDSNGNPTRTYFTSQASRESQQLGYDDFSRVVENIRIPGGASTNSIATVFQYDAASHVIRTSVRDGYTIANTNSGTVISDKADLFDEAGFNYQTNQRSTANTNSATDVVTKRDIDFAASVMTERTVGDSTVGDRLITTHYDRAGRSDYVTDAEGGRTAYTRDQRGNITNQAVQFDSNTSHTADTTTVFDALSRATRVVDPPDAATSGVRNFRDMQYDSRGNLLSEVFRDASSNAKMSLGYAYDNAGRQTRSVTFANPASTNAASADVSSDRVVDVDCDTDGRPVHRITYNNNSSTPHATTTTYDNLGRVDVVTDASTNYVDDDYATNGLRSKSTRFDGVGTIETDFVYDGHDRIASQTELGTPNLTTSFGYDGLDRGTSTTSPRTIVTTTLYDLIGRRTQVKEDSGGSLERETDYAYNTLSQLISQTAKNKDATTNLPDQVTQFRHDTMDRLLRTTYPDASDVSTNCTDCVKNHYDAAGRMDASTNQRGMTSAMVHDERGLLLIRIANTNATTNLGEDSFAYDALRRLVTADRGSNTNSTATSHETFAYNALGDMNTNTQQIAGGTTRTTTIAHDQAGNRTGINYPSGVTVDYTPTPTNQVLAITVNGSAMVGYTYANTDGLALTGRSISTPGGSYTYAPGYDTHRRVSSIDNSFTPSGGSPSAIADYAFTRDADGDVNTQSASGIAPFADDDRTMTVDNLARLTATAFTTLSGTESQTLDLAGNRESFTSRGGSAIAYATTNAANEYGSIGGVSVQYDADGNLVVDEAGRHYTYDDHDRCTHIQDASSNPLADFTYDGLGRRITFTAGGVTTRYYYDGPSIIEERDGSDVRQRFHVHGTQYADEHVATYSDASSSYVYYLHNDLYTVVGVGNASGMVQESYNYGAYGLSSISSMSCLPGDLNASGTVTTADIPFLVAILLDGTTNAGEECAADLNGDGMVDGTDVQIFENCLLGGSCPSSHSGADLRTPYTMHGAPVVILSDGLMLQHNGARDYIIQDGRWLQRDPKGYANGGNLYEAFGTNPTQNVDPSGEGFWTLVSGQGFFTPAAQEKASRDEFIRYWEAFALRSISKQNNLDDTSRDQLEIMLPEQVASIGEGVLLTAAAFNPLDEYILRSTNTRLAGALTPKTRFDLVIKGPAQGGLDVVNGAQDIVVDLANLGLKTSPAWQLTRFATSNGSVALINSPDWSANVVLWTPDSTHRVSKVLGGNAFLIVVPHAFLANGATAALAADTMVENSVIEGAGIIGEFDYEAANARVLFQTGRLRGVEPASQELLEAVAGKGRSIAYAMPGSDELRYLDYMNANANVGGGDLTHILLRPDPRKIEVLEEFLHGTQQRIGIVEGLGSKGAEIHVKVFMIQHQRLLGISAGDARILQQMIGK